MLTYKTVLETLQEVEELENKLEKLQQKVRDLEILKTKYQLGYESVKKTNNGLVDLVSDLWVEVDERKLNDVY